MNYRFEKVLAFVFLLAVLLLTWYLFLYDDFIGESDDRIAGIFVSLALGFGIFQLWINEINIDRRKLYEWRYETYKEIVLQIDEISETLNLKMTGDEIGSVHNLVSRLMNHVNRINSAVAINSDFLFPDLQLKPETKSIVMIVENILTRTDEFRMKFEDANQGGREIAHDFLQSMERMQWHNEIREHLTELHLNKYEFYRILRTYF
jgi:hypothetical protein